MNGKPGPDALDWPERWGLWLTVGFLFLAAVVVGGALSFVDQAGRRTIAAAQAETVAIEVAQLRSIYDAEGRDELLTAIRYRLTTRNDTNERIYALTDPQGRLIAGNLRRIPDGLIPGLAWQKLGENSLTPVYLSSVRLQDDSLLIVGNTDAAMDRFRSQIVEAGFIALVIVVAVCFIAAALITLYVRSKVLSLATVASKVTRGDFSARAEGAEEASPFGQIARAQNVMLERIEHLVVGLTTITDSLAHDLRTPLSRLKRFLESGIEAQSEADRDQALEAALQQSNHIVSTFSTLIDIARASGGLSRDVMDMLDLRSVLVDVQTLFEPLIEERGGHLVLEAPDPVKVLGHRALLMQAVSNLVENAIKHAPEGTNVTLGLRSVPGHAEVIVSDSGTGVPHADREQLLKRFTQGDNEPPGGIGLGLAIAKACAVLHKGSIWLEDNEPGLRVRLVLSKD